MVLFMLGVCTRVTSVLTWFGALCYIHRAPEVLYGVDTMMVILLLYLMIGPSGGALSLDRWLARWWAVRRARREGRPEPPWQPPQPSATANLAIRLIQVHFCIIYLAAGMSKLLGGAWWNGTAIWYTMSNYEFAPFPFPPYVAFLRFLGAHRVLRELFLEGGVVFTLMLEIGLPFLIWQRRLRWLMIVGAVMLHLGISMSMGLTNFGLTMITMVVAFVPPETVRAALRPLAKLLRPRAAGALAAARPRPTPTGLVGQA
jgi:hypothetical protein